MSHKKHIKGKPKMTLVPWEITRRIAWVREYGNTKYIDPDNWRDVEPELFRDALMRHAIAYLEDPESVDPESGFLHLDHLACNVAFLIELDKEGIR